MNIGDLVYTLPHPNDKSALQKMIDKFGLDETVNRFVWLYGETKEKVNSLIEQLLTDDYVDDRGERGGKYFF